MPGIAIPFLIIAAVAVITVAFGYVKAPPDKAYIISGLQRKSRVLIGRAGIRFPFFERIDKLYLGTDHTDSVPSFGWCLGC